jgi:hypothetical protein
MSAPEYVLCLDCETPCYVFEWRNDKLKEALCTTCGNDELGSFATPAELEELTESSGSHQR